MREKVTLGAIFERPAQPRHSSLPPDMNICNCFRIAPWLHAHSEANDLGYKQDKKQKFLTCHKAWKKLTDQVWIIGNSEKYWLDEERRFFCLKQPTTQRNSVAFQYFQRQIESTKNLGRHET
jgi:hypothetical protein